MIKVYCDRCGELIASSSSELLIDKLHKSTMNLYHSIDGVSESDKADLRHLVLCDHCMSLLRQVVYEFLEESNLIAVWKNKKEKAGDVIYRQDAIDALGEEPPVWNDEDYEIAERNQWRADVAAIEAVPTASSEKAD